MSQRDAHIEDSIDRIWESIIVRRELTARRRRAFRIGGMLAICAVSALSFSRWTTAPSHESAKNAASLLTANGGPIVMMSAMDQAETFAFDDASHVTLSPGAHLTPRVNDGEAFISTLEGGATFDVTPGGVRHWSVECNFVTVDVIGTRFSVVDTSSGQRRSVRVSVEHGIVVVRGENVPDHERRMIDGESIDISQPEARTPPTTSNSAEQTMPIAPQIAASRSPSPPPLTPSWHDLANRGDYADAYRQLGPEGLSSESAHASVDDLLALADVARLSAHPRDALPPLARVVTEHRTDPRAPLAAFTIGRVELDTLGDPPAAARAFQQAIDLGLPDGLLDDAYVRLAEADSKAGDPAGARAASEACDEKHRGCSRSSAMLRWISGE